MDEPRSQPRSPPALTQDPGRVGDPSARPRLDHSSLTAHVWLFDPLLPIYGDLSDPVLEGWSLLAALAAQTERLGLGLIVTSNRFRAPAGLAKIAATVDIVSTGRLTLGIGVGSAPGRPLARREYDASGIPFISPRDAVDSLDEACTIITRLWSENDPFDFDGAHHRMHAAHLQPKPAQDPRPPIPIGGWGERTLGVIARHADIWNIPGAPMNDTTELLRRPRMLDDACTEVGRTAHHPTDRGFGPNLRR